MRANTHTCTHTRTHTYVSTSDGQMRTATDVLVAGLLGADEVGFGTAPLIGI